MTERDLSVSVVVPTRDRPDSLRRMLRALAAQQTTRHWELIVVDDSSSPPVDPAWLNAVSDTQLIRGPGRGPATARNLGLFAAHGPIVLFTDDDTEPDPGWLQAAADYLDSHPDAVGVEGPVRSAPYDPLFAHSLEQDRGGGYMTCNLGLRHETLRRIGGFSEDYPFPHCEDLDLAYRSLVEGRIGFAPTMSIVHYPRPLTAREWMLRGRMAESEIVLFARFPDRFGRAARLPPRAFPLAASAGVWRLMVREGRRGPWRRALRAAAIAIGYTAVVLWISVRAKPENQARAPVADRERPANARS